MNSPTQSELLELLAYLTPQERAELDSLTATSHKELAVQAEQSLLAFVRQGWHVVEPHAEYVHGWHIDAICDHLEAVSRGEIRNLIINVPPGHMKPVAVHEMVLEQTRGRIPLSEVLPGDRVLTHCGRFRDVLAVHEQGDLPVVRVRTAKGRAVTAAPDHPFLTVRGWVQAAELVPGDVLGVVRVDTAHGMDTLSAVEARLLGYLVGDGCVKYNEITVTNADAGVLEDVRACARALGFTTRDKIKPGCRATCVVLGGRSLRPWLAHHDLRGKCSYTKRAPSAVLAASSALIAQFIGAYWSCDGHIAVRPESKRGTQRVLADTVGEALALDVQHLLLRLGISAAIYRKTRPLVTKRQGATYVSYRITVDADDAYKFGQRVPMAHQAKQTAASAIQPACFDAPLAEDRVIAVEPAGAARCRCLTVAEDHSFTAGDLAVHNSLTVCVFWPAWDWLREPYLRWLFASYSSDLSTRDSNRTKLILQSDWYRRQWGDRFRLTKINETRLENDKTGFRLASSTGGLGTGERVHRSVNDDLLRANDAHSKAMRAQAIAHLRAMASRGVEPTTYTQVLIMQRLHEEDPAGWLLSEQPGMWEHLCLPARFEKKRLVVMGGARELRDVKEMPTKIGWVDPRTEEGELLFPQRFPATEIANIEQALGSYGAAGQLQQRPSPDEGGIFKRAWWKSYRIRPAVFDEVIQSWDCTFKGLDTSDYVAGHVWGRIGADKYLLDRVHARMSFPETLTAVRGLSYKWPEAAAKLIEDAANGPAVIDSLRREIPGLIAVSPDGGKTARAHAVSPEVEAGNVYLPDPSIAPWVHDFIEECATFPNAAHDDDVDAMTQALLRWRRNSGFVVGSI